MSKAKRFEEKMRERFAEKEKAPALYGKYRGGKGMFTLREDTWPHLDEMTIALQNEIPQHMWPACKVEFIGLRKFVRVKVYEVVEKEMWSGSRYLYHTQGALLFDMDCAVEGFPQKDLIGKLLLLA